MLQINATNATTQIGTIGNGGTVRANIVARGMRSGLRKRLHRGKPLSSCRPYCFDWSEHSQEASSDWLQQSELDQPSPVAASARIPARAWAAMVVRQARSN